MKRRLPSIVSRLVRCHRRDLLGDDGSVAVELGLLASFFLVPLLLGIIQYGLYFNATQSLAAATRVGAEYARNGGQCQSGINTLVNPPTVSAACLTNIKSTINNSINLNPPLSSCTVGGVPPSGACKINFTCQCDDATTITCGNSCAAAGRPAPNRLFITVSANQPFTPFVALWTVPTTINGVTDIRIQ